MGEIQKYRRMHVEGGQMRKEDEQAIRRAIALLKIECQEHPEGCRRCIFWQKRGEYYMCIFDNPPSQYDANEIIDSYK